MLKSTSDEMAAAPETVKVFRAVEKKFSIQFLCVVLRSAFD
jgi:hypothetical protein